MSKIKLIFKIEGTDECLEEYIELGEEVFFMGADIFTYSIFFDDMDEDIDFAVVTRKYDPVKRRLTILARRMNSEE